MIEMTCGNCGASLQISKAGQGYTCDYCGTVVAPTPVPEAEVIPEAPLLAEPLTPSQPVETPPQPRPKPSPSLIIDPSIAQIGSSVLGIPKFISGCFSFLFVVGFLGLFIGFAFFSDCRSEKRREKRYLQRTQESMRDASERIESKAQRESQLPDNIEGTRWIRSVRDGWQNDLSYERSSERSFKIVSCGADEILNTADDMEMEFTVDLHAGRD